LHGRRNEFFYGSIGDIYSGICKTHQDHHAYTESMAQAFYTPALQLFRWFESPRTDWIFVARGEHSRFDVLTTAL